MAKIAKKIVWWSSVSGANSYSVRIIPDNEPFAYDYPAMIEVDHALGLAEHEADIGGIDLPEGRYDIYVTAKDEAGNESDPFVLPGAFLDFVPPASPSSGGFR